MCLLLHIGSVPCQHLLRRGDVVVFYWKDWSLPCCSILLWSRNTSDLAMPKRRLTGSLIICSSDGREGALNTQTHTHRTPKASKLGCFPTLSPGQAWGPTETITPAECTWQTCFSFSADLGTTLHEVPVLAAVRTRKHTAVSEWS